MKRIIILLILITFFSCQSQSKKMSIVANEELSYVLSNMLLDKIERKELFNSSAFLTVFKIADSKATKDDTFEATDEVLSSYYISIIPDGDYYTTSKLYKIEGYGQSSGYLEDGEFNQLQQQSAIVYNDNNENPCDE